MTNLISNAINPQPLTLDTMIAAIDKLKVPPQEQEENTLCGMFIVKRRTWMKGMEVIVICGDKAYCWPEGLAGKEVKVIRIPEYKPEELMIDWSF